MAGVVIDLEETYTATEQATSFDPDSDDGREIRVTGTKKLRKPITTETPPLHPRCRCTEGLVEVVGDQTPTP
jgi:hypothetical protein